MIYITIIQQINSLYLLCYVYVYIQHYNTYAYYNDVIVSDQLARQLMMQQLQIEEKTRTDGDSGIKMIRLREQGHVLSSISTAAYIYTMIYHIYT